MLAWNMAEALVGGVAAVLVAWIGAKVGHLTSRVERLEDWREDTEATDGE